MDEMWNQFMKQLRQMKSVDVPGVFQSFTEAKGDEDRILLIMHLFDTVKFKLTLHRNPKNATKSEQLREKGNKLYTAIPLTTETCLEAFKLYSKSIAYAPIGSKQQALAYANRSALLCRIKKYVECLKDIERAFSLNYPDVLRSKLYLRKIECLAALKGSDLDNAINEANSWCRRMSMNDSNRTKFNDNISCLIKEGRSKSNTARDDIGIITSLPIIQNPNPEVPCASNAVAIKYNEHYGRHLIATRDINPGEILIVEKPYVMLLEPNNVETHCHYCLEVCWSTIPCDSCTYAMYCSEECKTADWKASHDIECPIFSVLEKDSCEKYFMTLRLTTVAIRRSGGIHKLKKIVKEVDETKDMRTKGFSKNGLYQSDQYRSIYSLSRNSEKRSGTDLLNEAFYTLVIMNVLCQCPNQTLIPKDDKDAFLFVAGLMLRHSQTISTNSHCWDEVVGTLPLEIDNCNYRMRGMVLMPLLSLTNHSCDMYLVRQSALGHMIVYTTNPIDKGQQIFDNYGVYFENLSRARRQAYLLQNYFFSCRCSGCQCDWSWEDSLQPAHTMAVSCAQRRAMIEVVEKHLLSTDRKKQLSQYFNESQFVRLLQWFEMNGRLKNSILFRGNRFVLPQL